MEVFKDVSDVKLIVEYLKVVVGDLARVVVNNQMFSPSHTPTGVAVTNTNLTSPMDSSTTKRRETQALVDKLASSAKKLIGKKNVAGAAEKTIQSKEAFLI